MAKSINLKLPSKVLEINPKLFLDQLGTLDVPALGFIELSSISRGLYLTDAILKKAPVKVVTSQPISSGKHVIVFIGDVAAVEESFKEAVFYADGTLLKELFIPGVHQDLAPYLDSLWSVDAPKSNLGEAIGVVESSTLSGAILAADRSLKTAHVSLYRMRLGQGIGGKAYFIISGKQEEVEAGLESAQQVLKELQSAVRTDLIANPTIEALYYF